MLQRSGGPGGTPGLPKPRGYGKLEILFAVSLLIVGITGMVMAFAVKRAPEVTEGAVLTPTRALEELADRMEKQRVFSTRVKAGKEWIHDDTNSPVPIRVQPESSLYWSARASRNYLDPDAMQKDAQPPKALPEGKYQIAIFIYRDYTPGAEQRPVAQYTMMVETEPNAKPAREAAKDSDKK